MEHNVSIFIPLTIASGGNSGSWATSMVIRAMAVGDVTSGDWLRVMRREIMTRILLGCVLGAVGLLRVILGQTVGMDPGEGALLLTLRYLCIMSCCNFCFLSTTQSSYPLLSIFTLSGRHRILSTM